MTVLPDWITAVSTGLLAALTVWIAFYAKKTLYGNTVSNSRPPYISTLRMSFAKLYSSLLLQDKNKIIKTISFVKYHFNQYEGIGIDDAFIENCLDKLLEKSIKKQEITQGEIDKYRKWSSAILQYEWQCFKDEISKGRKLTDSEKRKNKDKIIDNVLIGI